MGGRNPDLVQDFVFSRQHDARFVSHNETYTVISFLNNASDEEHQMEEASSAMVVGIERKTKPLRARLLARYERPDRGLTRLRGNVQVHPGSGNVFVGWSQQGYHSEFLPNGTLIMDAQFANDRFSTYRTYKFPFVGYPAEPPILKAFLYGDSPSNLNTVMYTSWNGATEVASYRFWAKSAEKMPSIMIGSTERTGFETTFIANGYLDWVTAEAFDSEGNVLARTDVERTILPKDWLANADGFKNTTQLVPGDPVQTLQHGWSPEGNHTVTYSYTKEWYSPDRAQRFLALVGVMALMISFGSIAILIGASVMRAIRRCRRRQYDEVDDDDDDVDDSGRDTEMQDRGRHRP